MCSTDELQYQCRPGCAVRINHMQRRGESGAAGEAARLMAPPPPPQSYIFCLLVWDAFHAVGTTSNDRWSLPNTFGWMGALQAPKPLHGRVLVAVQRLAPWKLQRICILRYPNLGQQYVDSFPFFSCSLQYKVTGKSQRSKIFNSHISYQKKMCIFYSSSWIIFLKFKRQAI